MIEESDVQVKKPVLDITKDGNLLLHELLEKYPNYNKNHSHIWCTDKQFEHFCFDILNGSKEKYEVYGSPTLRGLRLASPSYPLAGPAGIVHVPDSSELDPKGVMLKDLKARGVEVVEFKLEAAYMLVVNVEKVPREEVKKIVEILNDRGIIADAIAVQGPPNEAVSAYEYKPN